MVYFLHFECGSFEKLVEAPKEFESYGQLINSFFVEIFTKKIYGKKEEELIYRTYFINLKKVATENLKN